MKKSVIVALAIVAGSVAQADTVTVNIAPSQVPDGNTPFLFGGAPTGFGPDSWQNNNAAAPGKVNWHARAGEDGNYLGILFPNFSSITIGDIASISYWTNRPGGSDAGEDWALYIYTQTDSINDMASWYGDRYINDWATHNTTDTWVNHSTDTGMQFTSYTPAGVLGSYDGFSTFQAAHSTELVEMISVQTHSNFGNYHGYMDGLVIKLNNGDEGIVNFGTAPVVPIPAAAPLGLLGMGLVAFVRRRKNAKA